LNITEKLQTIINGLPNLGSEIFLTLSFVLLLVVELLLYKKKSSNSESSESQKWLWAFTLAIVLFTGYITISQAKIIGNFVQPSSYFILDSSASFFKLIILLAATFVLFHIKILKYTIQHEFYPLLVFQLIGLFLLTISTNFLLIYVSIEIISIASYIFAALQGTKKAAEASLKYALFGGISSAIMLYGISFIYGITGSLDILDPNFIDSLSKTDSMALSFVLLLTFGGILFKISAFPFHLWVADVYEATPTPIVSFLSIAPKAAGILVLTRLITLIPQSQQNIIIIVAIFSIAIGNFSALRQQNIKRMLAYSTIAQTGFILGSLACFSNLGIQAAYFYLFGFVFSNILAFFLIDQFDDKNNTEGYQLKNYSGMGLQLPFWGILIIISMVSLTGLPPTVGFSGKLFIFSAIIEAYQVSGNKLMLILFIFGLINTAIALFFYLRIPYFAFLKSNSSNKIISLSKAEITFATILALPIIFYFIKADSLMNWIAEIIK
jgi:NADH-quinone oxidoreductase subunit N